MHIFGAPDDDIGNLRHGIDSQGMSIAEFQQIIAYH